MDYGTLQKEPLGDWNQAAFVTIYPKLYEGNGEKLGVLAGLLRTCAEIKPALILAAVGAGPVGGTHLTAFGVRANHEMSNRLEHFVRAIAVAPGGAMTPSRDGHGKPLQNRIGPRIWSQQDPLIQTQILVRKVTMFFWATLIQGEATLRSHPHPSASQTGVENDQAAHRHRDRQTHRSASSPHG